MTRRKKKPKSPPVPTNHGEEKVVLHGDGGTVQTTVISQILESFTGPIPDPKNLQAYKEIDPSIPDRILTMAERQSSHRQNQETLQVKGVIGTRKLGLWLALISVLAICFVGAYTIKLGHPKEGCALIGAVVVSLAGTFIYKSRKNEQ